MNFHKTIGFLATLLLMVGLGAPDSFAQTMTVSNVSPSTIREGQTRNVTVTVQLSTAPAAGTTVAVDVGFPRR